MPSPLVWLITGTSSGIGRELAEAALQHGDKVIATARTRSFSQLDQLRAKGADTLDLDVTYPRQKLDEIAKEAVELHGHIDVLVNNAGYFLTGSIEEITEQETLEQFNTNLFGALSVTRAFLPYMRERKSGTIIFIGSMGGWASAADAGIYSATKAGLRAISVALSQEVGPLGLRVACVDLGVFRTRVLLPGHRKSKISRVPDYVPIINEVETMLDAIAGNEPGDPAKAARTIVHLVHGEGPFHGKEFPTNLVLGSDLFNVAKQVSHAQTSRLDEFEAVSKGTDFDASMGYDVSNWRAKKGI